MKYLKEFKIFESVSETEIHSLCKAYGIENYTINPDGTIDVEGDVNLYNNELTKLPLSFNKVTGDFNCYENKLTSLEGAPKEVRVDFDCGNNQLKNLIGAPERVGGHFTCYSNQLKNLIGAPGRVGGYFDCTDNQLTSLEGLPERTSNIYCRTNKIMNIDGLLWKSFKNIYLLGPGLSGNPVFDVVGKWINSDNNEELIEYFIDLNVIQGDKVIMERLKAFHEEMGLEMEIDFKEVEKYYTIIN